MSRRKKRKNRANKRLRQKTTNLKPLGKSGRKTTNPMTRTQRRHAGKGRKDSVQ